jgi:Reversibly glycosylated polypeptide
MEDRKVAVVVASNREDQFLEFLTEWHGKEGFPWDVTILVQDGGGALFRPHNEAERRCWRDLIHHDWTSISEAAGSLPDWLARCDSGIKVWGFLDAVFRFKADVVITLDDDCLPCSLAADPSWHRRGMDNAELIEAARSAFVSQHLYALYNVDRWTTTIPGFVPRGMPYGTADDGHRQPRLVHNSRGSLSVSLNMGVWATTPDRDAVHELTNWTTEGYYKPWKPTKSVYRHSRVMSPQQYWPMCGMNLAFRRELAPLMYFPRMGDGTPFRRFDDIWGGVVAQKCMRHLGLACTVGKPIISHVKASVAMNNLVRESPGIKANEEFWKVIDRLELRPQDNTPLRCMDHLGVQLTGGVEEVQDEQLRNYMPKLGLWIRVWCDQFLKAGWES